jgi:hypothetical protein
MRRRTRPTLPHGRTSFPGQGRRYLHSDIEFFGIFADLKAVTERMEKDGYVCAENADDTVAWITDEEILKLWSR